VKANKTTRGQAVSNHRRIKDKESESNIDSAAHFTAGITTYLSTLMLNVNGLNSPIKGHRLANWI
jgi:hypothetical protein